MSTSVQPRPDQLPSPQTTGSSRGLSRLAHGIGFVMILIFDLLALDDITTAGARMPEIGFLLASIPALITTGYLALRRPAHHRPIEAGLAEDGLAGARRPKLPEGVERG